LKKGGVIGENTESDHWKKYGGAYRGSIFYLPESDCKELVGKWSL
jgi:hypothetical protein